MRPVYAQSIGNYRSERGKGMLPLVSNTARSSVWRRATNSSTQGKKRKFLGFSGVKHAQNNTISSNSFSSYTSAFSQGSSDLASQTSWIGSDVSHVTETPQSGPPTPRIALKGSNESWQQKDEIKTQTIHAKLRLLQEQIKAVKTICFHQKEEIAQLTQKLEDQTASYSNEIEKITSLLHAELKKQSSEQALALNSVVAMLQESISKQLNELIPSQEEQASLAKELHEETLNSSPCDLYNDTFDAMLETSDAIGLSQDDSEDEILPDRRTEAVNATTSQQPPKGSVKSVSAPTAKKSNKANSCVFPETYASNTRKSSRQQSQRWVRSCRLKVKE